MQIKITMTKCSQPTRLAIRFLVDNVKCWISVCRWECKLESPLGRTIWQYLLNWRYTYPRCRKSVSRYLRNWLICSWRGILVTSIVRKSKRKKRKKKKRNKQTKKWIVACILNQIMDKLCFIYYDNMKT